MTARTVEHRHSLLIDSQRRVLERIASGAPLEEVLATLVSLIEEQAGDMRCAVLLADAGQTRLRFVAAPYIPQDYKVHIEPYLLIAPQMGSCGTAAYLKQPVYTRDTANDPRWKGIGDIAARNGLRAIWSTPILSDDSAVLGTFAMYYDEPRLPDREHIQLIDMAVQMARVAIEAKADEDLVGVAFDNSPVALMIVDVEGRIARANHAFARQLGYSPADLRGRMIAEITEGFDHAALLHELEGTDRRVPGARRYRTRGGRIVWARERSSIRRDAGGDPRYVVSQIEHVSEADPLAVLSSRERAVLKMVVAGSTSKTIAAKLAISPASVDTYRSRIMLKLDIEDLPALVRFAIRHGIASI